MNKLRLIALALVVAAFAVVVAGCGGDEKTSASTDGSTTASTDAAMKSDDAMSKGDAMSKDEAMSKDDAMMKDDAKMAKDKAMTAKADKTVRTGKTSYGKIIQDGRGRTLYLFTKDSSKSKCYGDCAKAWPPLIVKATPNAKGGVKADLLGTVKRKNGKLQATYNGHPLYYYVGETKANQVLCQAVAEFGGIWYIVNPNGTAKKS